MFRVIEGNVVLMDEATGEAIATVSGVNGIALQVREQNLDDEGYIRNSAHNFAKHDNQWQPFTLTSDGRLRVDILESPATFLALEDTPSTYTGSTEYFLRVASTTSGIEFVPVSTVASGISHFDLQDIGSITHSGIDVHIGDSTIHFPWEDVDAVVSTASGTLQAQIDYYKYHGNLLELDQDHHPVYVPRDGSRGFTSTVSGVDPTEYYHLTTRQFLEDYIAGTASGTEPPQLIFFIRYAIDENESSTNSTSYIEKLNITVSGCMAGTYRVGVSYFWRHSKLNTDFKSRVQIDDTETVFEYVTSPYVDVNVWRPVSSFHYEELDAGDHTIDFDFASSSNGSTSFVKDVALEFWRVE